MRWFEGVSRGLSTGCVVIPIPHEAEEGGAGPRGGLRTVICYQCVIGVVLCCVVFYVI